MGDDLLVIVTSEYRPYGLSARNAGRSEGSS